MLLKLQVLLKLSAHQARLPSFCSCSARREVESDKEPPPLVCRSRVSLEQANRVRKLVGQRNRFHITLNIHLSAIVANLPLCAQVGFGVIRPGRATKFAARKRKKKVSVGIASEESA